MKTARFCLVFLAAVLAAGGLAAAERIPPAPPRHFNDYAGVVSPKVAAALDARLAQCERESSNQLLVALYPRMESDSSVQDYTVRVAQAWRSGQSARDNGAVLFAFMQERQLYLQVGYGLEGVLPDALAKRIIEQEIVPRFRQGDVDGGMTAAVDAMIAATRGEYRGTGRTDAETQGAGTGGGIGIGGAIALIVIFMVLSSLRRARGMPMVFHNPSRRLIRQGGPWLGGGGFGGGGWSGGGGGFSGGGGSFGGGGAGGRW